MVLWNQRPAMSTHSAIGIPLTGLLGAWCAVLYIFFQGAWSLAEPLQNLYTFNSHFKHKLACTAKGDPNTWKEGRNFPKVIRAFQAFCLLRSHRRFRPRLRPARLAPDCPLSRKRLQAPISLFPFWKLHWPFACGGPDFIGFHGPCLELSCGHSLWCRKMLMIYFWGKIWIKNFIVNVFPILFKRCICSLTYVKE